MVPSCDIWSRLNSIKVFNRSFKIFINPSLRARMTAFHQAGKSANSSYYYYLWIVLRFFSPYSLARMKTTVLCRYLPQGWTGMEGGLFTTTRSSFLEMILISSDDTGTSCLNREIFRIGKLTRNLARFLQ